MKKKIIIIGTIILLALIAVFIYLSNSSKTTNEIILKTNGGVSYLWEFEIENNDIIKYKEKESLEKRKNVVGGEIEEHYIFKGLNEGKTIITFRYRNFVDNTVDKTKKYKVKVDKKLKVNIKEIK